MLMDGRALTIAENCKSGEGLELRRKLVEAYKPKAGSRAALLVRILTLEFDVSDFLNRLEKWEKLINQHDANVDELDGVQERLKIETLISRVGKGVVQDHLVGVAKYTRFEQHRKDLIEYHSAKKHLGGDSSGSGRDHGGPTSMEIGMVRGSQYGKRQSKGGGDGKGSHHRQICEHLGKPGHVKQDCWNTKKRSTSGLAMASASLVKEAKARAKA